jgi:CheY-like chemotaxis protein
MGGETIDASAAAPSRGAILVVDDDDLIRSLCIAALELHGFATLEAPGGAEAVRIVATCPHVDLVVMDLVMPEMGGIECARKLRQFRPDLPVLFVSGFDPECSEPFLPKPYRAQDLAVAVRSRLDRRHASGNGAIVEPDEETEKVQEHS